VRSIEPATAREGTGLTDVPRVRVTHAFHPWAGQELEFVKRRHNWRADRVYVRGSAGELVSLPAEWTDAVAADPFVVVSAGRSPFHVEGLLELAELVARLTPERSVPRSRRVKQTMP
jgi:hypothetical protein